MNTVILRTKREPLTAEQLMEKKCKCKKCNVPLNVLVSKDIAAWAEHSLADIADVNFDDIDEQDAPWYHISFTCPTCKKRFDNNKLFTYKQRCLLENHFESNTKDHVGL